MVEARRGAHGINPNSNAQLDITLLPVNNATGYPNNSYHGGNVNNVPVQHKSFKHPSNHTNDTCIYGVSYQNNGFTAPRGYGVNGQDVMLDILDGYLGTEGAREKPHGAPNTVRILNVFYSVFYAIRFSVQTYDLWFSPPVFQSTIPNQSVYADQSGRSQWPGTGRFVP